MNQAINFFWTILCFIPVGICWYNADNLAVCYWFIGLSFLCMLVPIGLLQLNNAPAFYTGVGIKFFRRFVQNGDLANRATRRNKPGHAIVKHKSNAKAYIKTLAMYHAYHFGCFVFFLASMAYAIVYAHYLLAALIAIANVIYNIYPMLLQQYNYARILKIKLRQQDH